MQIPDSFLPITYAETKDYTRDSGVKPDNGVRLYPCAPGQVMLQVRTFGQVAPRGVYRKIVSSAPLNVADAKQLHALLGQWLSTQEPQAAPPVTGKGL